MLIWDRRFWLWNRNLSTVTVTKITIAQKWKKERKKHKEDAKADVETEAASEEDEEPPVPLVTHVNKFCTQLLQCWSLHQKSTYIQFKWTPWAQVLLFQKLRGGNLWVHGSSALRGVQFEQFLDKFTESSLPEPFFTQKMKLLSRPGGFSCCWLNWVLTFPPLSNC